MGFRLSGFDYTRPYFYMVTIRCLPGVLPLSAIVAPGRCQMNAITMAFVHVIRTFHERVAGLRPIECFSVMPDHIHLLIRIAGETEGKTFSFKSEGMPLGFYVEGLMAALTRAYWEVRAKAGDGEAKRLVEEARNGEIKRFAPVFFADWHDWIVKCESQLAVFTRYIRENPARSWLRRSHREYFQRVSEIDFLGLAGGRWIVLSPEGFGERWHPGRQYEKFCAEGRMLFISLWPAMAREPTKAELYARCHEMGDLVTLGLG